MADVQAGWYPDPWQQAPLRWWDGREWTGHVGDPSPRPAADGALSQLVRPGGRIAVVDVETTGLYNVDRVLEIGVITLDEHGQVLDRFETLVNPVRDVGPVWLHGITASMVANAPTFDDIAAEVAARLNGAVVCAHNLPFDARMLRNEFARSSIDADWGRGLDTLSVTGCKLGVACAEAGIDLDNAHSALADAHAASQLLLAYASVFDTTPIAARVGPFSVRPTRFHTRAGMPVVIEETPFVASLMASAHSEADVAPYIQLLDMAIADLRLTDDERAELEALAADLGINTAQRGRAHRDLVGQMIDAAVADHVVTSDEYDQLCRASALLDVEVDLVDRRTDGLRSVAATAELTHGMRVCFTGAATDDWGDEIPRSKLQRLATDAGFVAVNSVTASACDLLVAADPGSRSGKAAKARKFGIPIASVEDFLESLDTKLVPVSRLSSTGVALVCSRCGGSWLATRRSSRPVCFECREADRDASGRKPDSTSIPAMTPPSAIASAEEMLESLVCVDCGATWQRPRVRGRKPQRCTSCR
jgi:hypothetical protein